MKENLNKQQGVAEGVYGITKTGIMKSADKFQDDELADIEHIVVKKGYTCVKISRKQIEGTFSFEEAQEKAAELGEGWRPFTRHEWLDIYDMRFKGLDEFMQRLGMKPLNSWYWTCEEDADPQFSAAFAWLAYDYGLLDSYYKRNGYRVVAVSAFQI